jgi:transposase
MLGKRSGQRGMFDADHLYLPFVGEDTFYGFLARYRVELFCDDDFAMMYCLDNGRNSVPPSLLAAALLLQAHDRVSDAEAKRRADYDLCWKVALGIEIDERPFAKSTLQLFRGQLILHDRAREVFQRSLDYARETGYLKGRKMKAALDTTFILGRGAVKDTYNLLADGIKKLIYTLAKRIEDVKPKAWAQEHGFGRYFGSSIKGQAEIDWDDEEARRAFLQGIVTDADRLMEIARETLAQVPPGSEQEKQVRQAAELLLQLLCQDIEQGGDDGPNLKQDVAKDRVVSVHDPQMRYGHKSAKKRFEGHKLAIAADPESQLITAVDVLPGNAYDGESARELVEQSEENTGMQVEETIADCAFGDGATREEFHQAGRKLVAKVPKRPNRGLFPKEDFEIDLQSMTCTCPAGQVTDRLVSVGRTKPRSGEYKKGQAFRFDGAVCDACELRAQCTRAGPGKGRMVSLHPQERLLQEARALQRTPAFKEYQRMRQTSEHRLARMVQLGVRQARYFGRSKTLFQALMAATVANLTLIARKMGEMGAEGHAKVDLHLLFSQLRRLVSSIIDHVRTQIPSLAGIYASTAISRPRFRPGL